MKDLLKAIDKKIGTLERRIDMEYWGQFKQFVEDHQDQGIDKIDFSSLLSHINATFNREFRVISPAVKSKYRARLREGYTKSDILRAIANCKQSEFHTGNNYQYCTPTFFSQGSTLEKWGAKKKEEEQTSNQSPVN